MQHRRKWLSVLCILFSSVALSQSGSDDPTFNPGDLGNGAGDGADDTVYGSLVLPDGKILLVGSFYTYNGVARKGIVRLEPDGSVDADFDPGTGGATVYALARQVDGKVLIGGTFTSFNGTAAAHIVRLNEDGSVDAAFNPGTGANNTIYGLAIQSDNSILIGGSFTQVNGQTRNGLARLEANGSLDATFTPSPNAGSEVRGVIVKPDSRVLVFGTFTTINDVLRRRIAQLDPDGSLDLVFDTGAGANDVVNAAALQTDGKLWVAGAFTFFNAIPCQYLIKLNADGSIDGSTSPDMLPTGEVRTVSVQPDGNILIGGDFHQFFTYPSDHIARITSVGLVDPTFLPGSAANDIVYSLALQPNGRIIVAGSFTAYDGTGATRVAALNTSGTLDASFNIGTGANAAVRCIALQPDGKILIGGDFTAYNGVPTGRIARLNSEGTVDSSFLSYPGADLEYVGDIAVQADGKIIVVGSFTQFHGEEHRHIVRLNPDGTPDPTYDTGTGTSLLISAVALQADGKAVIVGPFYHYNGVVTNNVVRINVDGSLDPSFDLDEAEFQVGSPREVVIQTDGRILVGGDFYYSAGGVPHVCLVRIDPDGATDESFNSGDSVNYMVHAIAMQPDGKIVVGGGFSVFNDAVENGIVRLNADGSVDHLFDPGEGASPGVLALAVQPDTRLVVGGGFTDFDGEARSRVAKLYSNGSVDLSFDPGTGCANIQAPNTCQVSAVAIQPDGRVLIGGTFTSYDGNGRNRLARLIDDITTAVDTVSNHVFADVHPNPSQGVFMVHDASDSPSTFKVRDVTGRVIALGTFFWGAGQQFVNLTDYPKGAYVLEWHNGSSIRSRRLIVD